MRSFNRSRLLILVLVAIAAVITVICQRGCIYGMNTIVFSEGWSPDRSWGIRLCKTCSSADGVRTWLEVLDSNAIVQRRQSLLSEHFSDYDDCGDPDRFHNYLSVQESHAEIGMRLYDGRLDIQIIVPKIENGKKKEKDLTAP